MATKISVKNYLNIFPGNILEKYTKSFYTENYCIYDTETTGLNTNYGARMFSYSLYFPKTEELYINRLDRDNDFYTVLNQVFSDTSIVKVAHYIKFDRGMTEAICSVPLDTMWHCSLLLSQLLCNIEPSHGLDHLARKYLKTHIYDDIDKQVENIGLKYGYDKVPVNLMDTYQKNDTIRCNAIYLMLRENIRKKKNLIKVYVEELLIAKESLEIEKFGLAVDVKESKELLANISQKFDQVVEDTYKITGEYFNLHSDKQVRALLFERYKLPVLRKTKNSLEPKVDKDALFEYKRLYPDLKILDLILKWRSYCNGITNIKNYLALASKYGRVYTTIHPNQAISGRQASENVNLHNVQKPEALKNLYPVNSRRCFCADKGSTWFLADYRGIEIRIITELTREPKYFEMIANNTGDPHTYAAEIFFGELFTNIDVCLANLASISKNLFKTFKQEMKDNYASGGCPAVREKYYKKCCAILRTAAKNAQFAKAYGAGLHKISLTLNLAEGLLEPGYYRFKKELPLIFNFTRDIMAVAREVGYVTTPFGRILYGEPNHLYALSNIKVQSTAADVLKYGEIRVQNYIRKNWANYIKTVVPIHDELIFSVKNSVLKYFMTIQNDISLLMTDFSTNGEIKIPLETSWKMTKTTWDQAVEIE